MFFCYEYINKCKTEPGWKFIYILRYSRSHKFEITTWGKTPLSCFNKIFVSIRMEYTSYTRKVSNITNFPYNERLVVIFTTFGYAKDLYKFTEGTRTGHQTDHNTLALIERRWGQWGYGEKRQWRSCVNFIKTNICPTLFS